MITQQRGARLGCLNAVAQIPNGASNLESLGHDLFAATLHSAGANLISLGAIGWVVHAVTVVGEVGHGLVGRFSSLLVFGKLGKSLEDGIEVSCPQVCTYLLGPGLTLVLLINLQLTTPAMNFDELSKFLKPLPSWFTLFQLSQYLLSIFGSEEDVGKP